MLVYAVIQTVNFLKTQSGVRTDGAGLAVDAKDESYSADRKGRFHLTQAQQNTEMDLFAAH
jgi:hypothetical protein